jgi:hypothetical protein
MTAPQGPSEPDERLTLVLPYRYDGRMRYLLARLEFGLKDGDLVTDAGDRILSFASADAARALAARRFPDGDDTSEEARELAKLRRGLEEMYSPAVVILDLDAAAAWARRPESEPPDPPILLAVWRLLAWVGVAPEPAAFDPMGLAGLHMGRSPDAPLPDAEAGIVTAMKLDGIARDLDRRAGRAEPVDDEWSRYAAIWTAADARLVAGVLLSALPAFAARLTDHTDAP